MLAALAKQTDRPILVHSVVDESGFNVVRNPDLLAADTFQTGHEGASRNRLAHLHSEAMADGASDWLNLESWFEGIHDQFFLEDQLFAYCCSLVGGAAAHCYGAHGIWNVGDGTFLAHWGKQTFDAARGLQTPQVIAEMNRVLQTCNFVGGRASTARLGSDYRITRILGERAIE